MGGHVCLFGVPAIRWMWSVQSWGARWWLFHRVGSREASGGLVSHDIHIMDAQDQDEGDGQRCCRWLFAPLESIFPNSSSQSLERTTKV
jgi:hypothetical protein